jgi:hypothetical protein
VNEPIPSNIEALRAAFAAEQQARLKQLIRPVRGFKTLKTAYATIKGFEVMRAPRKGQAGAFNITRDIRGEARIIERAFGLGVCPLAEAIQFVNKRLELEAAGRRSVDGRPVPRPCQQIATELFAVKHCRGDRNRLGYALMLCYLHFPGHPLHAGERPPVPLFAFVEIRQAFHLANAGANDRRADQHCVDLGSLAGDSYPSGGDRLAVMADTGMLHS